jgi:putative peptide maturation system protein
LIKLAALRTELPRRRIDLVWDVEAVDGSVVYSLLVSDETCTYSLGAVARGAMPWPLRGAANPRADVLVTVDGGSVTVTQAIGVLDFVWRSRALADRIVDIALLNQERSRFDTEPTDSEVADAVRRLRAERGLTDDAAFHEWLRERRIGEENLRAWVAGVLVNRSLELAVVGARVPPELAHPERYQRARVLVADVLSSERAAAERLVREGMDVVDICEALGRSAGPRGLEVRDVLRYESEIVASTPAGETRLDAESAPARVFRVLSREAPPSGDTLRARVIKRLFAEHLREARGRADINWQWGNVAPAGSTFVRDRPT